MSGNKGKEGLTYTKLHMSAMAHNYFNTSCIRETFGLSNLTQKSRYGIIHPDYNPSVVMTQFSICTSTGG